MITATQDVAIFKVKRSRLLISDNNIHGLTFMQAITSSEWAFTFSKCLHLELKKLYFDCECETLCSDPLVVCAPAEEPVGEQIITQMPAVDFL